MTFDSTGARMSRNAAGGVSRSGCNLGVLSRPIDPPPSTPPMWRSAAEVLTRDWLSQLQPI